MITPDTVFKMVIPEWQTYVPMGDTIIAKYYKHPNKLPKKYKNASLKKFGKDLLYIDENGNKIISNPKQVGKKKMWRLNGQNFYSTNIHWGDRARIKNFYGNYFKKYIKKTFTDPFPIFEAYKIDMHIEIFEIYKKPIPDITNMWILAKFLEDSFVSEGILRDDSPEFRKKTSFSYTFIEKQSDRHLEIFFSYIKI